MYVCIYVCMRVYVYMYICMYVCIYVYIYLEWGGDSGILSSSSVRPSVCVWVTLEPGPRKRVRPLLKSHVVNFFA